MVWAHENESDFAGEIVAKIGSVPNCQQHCEQNHFRLVWQVNLKYYEANKECRFRVRFSISVA